MNKIIKIAWRASLREAALFAYMLKLTGTRVIQFFLE
jgi:hypothetical protein